MADIALDIKHLKSDVNIIHDFIEHLNTHSKICNELVKESNVREASELFGHIQEIDNRIHEVQKHLSHIKEHIEEESKLKALKEPIDIDDLKADAKHTSLDLKNIHTNIEHLIEHANMCQDIIRPSALEELDKIKEHILEIDEKAHELLNHIKEIRGGLSTEYSEFIWRIPEGLDEFIQPTQIIDCNKNNIKELALKLVDGADNIQNAIVGILCYNRDFTTPKVTYEKYPPSASNILESNSCGGLGKAILACALARAVNIPSKINFRYISPESWEKSIKLESCETPKEKFSIPCPEFYLNDRWKSVHEIFDFKLDVSSLHDKFFELGISKHELELNPEQWSKLPISELEDYGSYTDPAVVFESAKYIQPPLEIERRLFAEFVYVGVLPD